MTPEEEAAYALDWDLSRGSLAPAVQAEYDRLKMEPDARAQIQAATQPETERRIDVPDSPRRAIFIGKLGLNGLMRRLPEAQLEFFDWGIRLQRMHFKFLGLGDYYEIRYEELFEVLLERYIFYRVIVFDSDVLIEPVMFLTADYREILDRLERQGVPVNRDPRL